MSEEVRPGEDSDIAARAGAAGDAAKAAKQAYKDAAAASDAKPTSYKMRKRMAEALMDYKAAQAEASKLGAERAEEGDRYLAELATQADEKAKEERRAARAKRREEGEDWEAEVANEKAEKQRMEADLSQLKAKYKAAKAAHEDDPANYKKKKKYITSLKKFKAAEVTVAEMMSVMTLSDELVDTDSEGEEEREAQLEAEEAHSDNLEELKAAYKAAKKDSQENPADYKKKKR
jgi:colicin import membrane protein